MLSPLWLIHMNGWISTALFNQMEANEMGMLSHIMYTAHLHMCSVTLITLHLSSCSCMLLALGICLPALYSVYTAQLTHAFILYLPSCSPYWLNWIPLLPLLYATYTAHLLLFTLMLSTQHISSSASSCYLTLSL